jgi:hypothetical protein
MAASHRVLTIQRSVDMPGGFVQPTSWNLFGAGTQVRYFVAGPALIYKDLYRAMTFSGDKIRAVAVPDIGTLVSVTLGSDG